MYLSANESSNANRAHKTDTTTVVIIICPMIPPYDIWTIPENPMNAIAMIPVIIKVKGDPWRPTGTDVSLILDLIPAIDTIASIQPSPLPIAKPTVCKKL